MEHVMLDLETMGNDSDAVIISIGAVFFNGLDIGKRFSVNIDLQSSLNLGLSVTADTIKWWMKQHKDVQDSQIHASGVPIVDALEQFQAFLNTQDIKYVKVWGNGAAFDNVILRNAYESIGRGCTPWAYWNDRCYRTVNNLYPSVKISTVGNKHDSLADAVSQAIHLINIVTKHNINLK